MEDDTETDIEDDSENPDIEDDPENPDIEDDPENSDIEDDPENPGLRLRADELLAYQWELKEEKKLLQQMLERIDDQIHSLLVEQLHLLGVQNKSLQESGKTLEETEEESTALAEASTSKTLDFSVQSSLQCFEEEEED